MNVGEPRAMDALQQCFSSTGAERALQARRQFFEAGIRPSGLVSEAVIQSWLRSQRQHCHGRGLSLAPVSPSRLHATQERCRSLLLALQHELPPLEQALAVTGTRVMLTDDKGIVLHVSPAAMRPRDERVGLNMSEQAMGTNAPGIVAATGQACTVTNSEHYFDELHAFRCAAAPIRDVHGRLAGILNLMVEEQHFSFDASPVVGMYATTIENTLLQAQSHEHLVLRFQVTPALLHTPLQALMGVAADGRVAWMNGTAAQLIGRPGPGTCNVQELLGHDLSHLLRLSSQSVPSPLRLTSGLGVWTQVQLQTSHGLGTHLDTSTAEDDTSALATQPAAVTEAQPQATLREHSAQLIKETLDHHGGNVSQAARALGISRGTLYRRLRGDRDDHF
jgi:transcriptional regulator of acetoin/glycerol metabolism